MNNIKQKIKALKYARKQIASGKEEYICHALDNYMDTIPMREYHCVRELKAYISQSLTNNTNGYSSAGLELWLKKSGHIEHCTIAWQGQGVNKIRQTRLNWIDWMIACYEEDMIK